MNNNDLYHSRIIKTFVEYLGANYPGLNVNPVLDHSDMTVYRFNFDPAASCGNYQLSGY
jgi:hypothetical protein